MPDHLTDHAVSPSVPGNHAPSLPPPTRLFDLVDWAVTDSFRRVEVRGPHDLTNQILRACPSLTYEEAHAAAQGAWAGEFRMTGTFSAEPSWG